MGQIDQREKTLVFCANQTHALVMRDLINQFKTSSDPNYCQRVTADDGALGEQWLRDFQDNEKTIPTILTTSQKLSTGVDARNVRNIVLLRPVNSMIEFKQIIGRGTRLYDGKDYFTIYDFVRAHHHFSDPEWDGDPEAPEVPYPRPVPRDPPEIREPRPDDPPLRRVKERAAQAAALIGTHFDDRQRAFLDFVLAHYISSGVEELDQAKLTPLLKLKYRDSIADAVADLGQPEEIGRTFAGFQKYLYLTDTLS
jgi:hypothetical protein